MRAMWCCLLRRSEEGGVLRKQDNFDLISIDLTSRRAMDLRFQTSQSTFVPG